MPRHIFKAFLVIAAACGLAWSVQPICSPPQGICPSNWTEAQLIQDRYPFHLISPAWVSEILRWTLAETLTRFGFVVIGVTCIFMFMGFSRHKKLTT